MQPATIPASAPPEVPDPTRIDSRWLPIGTDYQVRNDRLQLTIQDPGDGRLEVSVEALPGYRLPNPEFARAIFVAVPITDSEDRLMDGNR